jgi:hypothetical protein
MKSSFSLLAILVMSTVFFFTGCEGEEDPPNSAPTLSTKEISSITGTTAMGGGEVESDGCNSKQGNSNTTNCQITSKGVCWSTSPGPTVALTTKTDEGPGFYDFETKMTGLTDGTTYFVRAYATNGIGTSYGEEVSFTTAAVVGDEFQGGILAYFFQSGDPGYVAGQKHGIVCSKEDFSASPWSNTNTNTGATASALGTGQANTTTIVANQAAGNYAARLCNDLVVGTYTDWFLPSAVELSKLYSNKVTIGNFNTQYYWSSSELDISSALRVDFLSGSTITNGKFNTHAFRPIRIF